MNSNGWFPQNGDKALSLVTAVLGLATTQASSLGLDAHVVAWLTFVVSIGTVAHTLFFPQNPAPVLPAPAASTTRQGGFTAVSFVVWLVGFVIISQALVLALACSAMPPPKTLDQSLAYVEGAVITAQQGVTTALTAGQISSAQAVNANNLALNVLSIVSTARAAESSNPTSAQNDLALAQTALTAVQTYLTTAKGK